jgi:hypothetical protein
MDGQPVENASLDISSFWRHRFSCNWLYLLSLKWLDRISTTLITLYGAITSKRFERSVAISITVFL